MTQTRRSWMLRSRPFLVYPVAIAAILAWIWSRQAIGIGATLLLASTGLLAWTLVEWVLHRAMHIRTQSKGFSRFQEQAHLCHHRAPADLEHSVVSLRGSVPLGVLFFSISLAAFRNLDWALAFYAGLLTGYVYYEFVHLASHGAWRLPFMRSLARYHAQHHYSNWNRSFGVTTPLWDWIFRTMPQSRTSNTRTQPSNSAAS